MQPAQAVNGELVSAILKIEKTYGRRTVAQEVEFERLQEALESTSQVELFTERDLQYRQAPQHPKAWHTAAVIVGLYNQGRRGKDRLTLWAQVAG